MATYGTTGPTSDLEWVLGKISIVARSWKLVLLGTIIITSAVLLAVFLFGRPIYTARMVVPLSPQVQALISVGVVASGVSVSQELAPNTRLHSVSVSNADPEIARAELQRAFEQIVTASKPSPSLRIRILSDIDTTQRALSELRGINESALRSTTLVSTEIENLEFKLEKFQLLLDGIRPDEVPQPPGKAVESWRPLSPRTALLVLLISFGLMAGLVLLRDLLPQRI